MGWPAEMVFDDLYPVAACQRYAGAMNPLVESENEPCAALAAPVGPAAPAVWRRGTRGAVWLPCPQPIRVRSVRAGEELTMPTIDDLLGPPPSEGVDPFQLWRVGELRAAMLPPLMSVPDPGGPYQAPLLQFIADWNRTEDRAALIVEAPVYAGDDPVLLPAIAVVVHARPPGMACPCRAGCSPIGHPTT